jgi:DNA-binding MarR family transcriptional regulator
MRQINVYLTDKGKNHEDRIRGIIGRLEEKVMKDITPEEAAAFINVLEKMKKNLIGDNE